MSEKEIIIMNKSYTLKLIYLILNQKKGAIMKLYLVTRSDSGTEYDDFTDEDYDWQNQFVDQIFTDFNSAMKYYKKCIHYMNKYNKNQYSNVLHIINILLSIFLYCKVG